MTDRYYALTVILEKDIRCDKKGYRKKDLEKAIWYLQREIWDER